MRRERLILDKHFRHWRERGLVPEELEARLRAASAEIQGDGALAVRRALALLGAALLVAGLVLMVAESWPDLPRSAKLLGWAALQAGFLLASEAVARRLPARPFLGEALAAVACGGLFAGIGLVGELYNLASRPPNALWLWLVLLLPLPFVLGRRVVSWAVFAALAGALGLECLERGSYVYCDHADGPWLWLGLPLLAGALVSLLPRPPARLGEVLGGWMFGVGGVFLLVFGAEQDLDRSDLGRAWAIAAAGLVVALVHPARLLPAAWGAATARAVLVLSVLPWALLGARFDRGAPLDQLAVGLAWIAQLGIAILLVRAGARSRAPSWVNLGYLAILAGVVVRYFDFFADVLEGGVALALSGGLVLSLVFALEKARRRSLAPGGRS